MWGNTELQADYARERYRDYLATAEHDRLVRRLWAAAGAEPPRRTAAGARAVQPGRVAAALWQGRPTTALRAYRASARSIKLN